MAFDQSTRNRLNRFVADSRGVLAKEFTRQLQAIYGMNPVTGEIADINSLAGLTPHQQETAQLLRDTFEHYLAANDHAKGKSKEKESRLAALDRIVREQAFTVLNRLAALRMSEARGFLIESLAKGYDSKGFQLFHRLTGTSLGETGDAYTHYLFSIFDEFALDLSVLFDRFAAQGRLFPSTPVLLELLALINDDEVAPLWAEDETIGWIYQYFNSQEERKKMRDASQAPRNSRELAVRNQFFTPRYVVEFLTDNTLGRIWYEMTKGQTKLVDECEYLVKRPNEIFLSEDEQAPAQKSTEGLSQEELLQQTVYIEHRALKDPRDIKMLDPACGSMHFGLYCFDLFERIYDEAWDIEVAQGTDCFVRENNQASLTQSYCDKAEFLTHVPRLIIESNIHGVDIDPRAAQVAGMSLWQRAHNSWQKASVKPQHRPQITKSNIVCAEPMPGEKELLQEFSSQLKPTVLGQLVEVIFEKMQLAGEAGTLLKIEKEIEDAITGAKTVWQQQNQALSQYPDLAKVAKQQSEDKGEVDFDVSDIDDESFWQQAEQKILEALAAYASSTSADMNEQKRLFASDAAKGFAFIDLCKKRFDVVLMNPPFGDASKGSLSYIKDTYSDWNKNILCAFTDRLKDLTLSTGFVAAVIDRSPINKSSYEKFRVNQLIRNDSLEIIGDFGWDVLDANVEVGTFILAQNESSTPYTYFFDVRDKKHKSDELVKIINTPIIHKTEFFRRFPNSSLVYDLPAELLKSFTDNQSFSEAGVIGYTGHQLQSERHFRLFWEAPLNEIIDKNNTYCFLYNGGDFTRYVAPKREIAIFGNYKCLGSDNFPSYSYRIQNKDKHFLPGVSFGKRGEYLDAHLLSEEAIFTVEGQCIPLQLEEQRYFILGILNSHFASRLLNTYAGQHKYSGYVNLLPIPSLDENHEKLTCFVKNIIAIKQKYFNFDETTINFLKPYIDIEGDIALQLKCFKDMLKHDEEQLKTLHAAIESEIIEIYKLNDTLAIDDLHEYSKLSPEETVPKWGKLSTQVIDEVLAKDLISYLIGKTFNRWSSNESERGILDTGNLIAELKAANESKLSQLLSLAGTPDLEKYLSKPNLFFDEHIERYSFNRKAPVYWQLQLPSLGYAVWLNYRNLDSQSLLSLINDYLQPKIDELIAEISALTQKHIRTSIEEKTLDNTSNLVGELERFRDEVLRLSKVWLPNLNDGVQITAAPLWRLFQHKAWQKKLKQTWEKLEEGEYDWAHLAFSTWPERVLKKCHEDRSLAIAHDVEDDLWHEVEVIKGRKKEPVWEWQPKTLSDAELHAYIREKIATDDRLKLYRSNQSANANGGAL